jgi:sporulation protein YlmC with PRC-barrel domain
MAGDILSWNDLSGRPIILAGQGRLAGTIEDFYFEPGTASINALRVRTRLHGFRILLPSAIQSLNREGVTIANEHMLIDEANAGPIYQLPTGNRLPSFTVVTESGSVLGTVRDILLGIYPPVALRISAFELADRRGTRISTHEVTGFSDNGLTVMNQVGSKVL